MEKQFVMNEYKSVSVSKKNLDFYLDCIDNFGYEITKKDDGIGKVTLHMKRAYLEKNVARIRELEKQFDERFARYERLTSTESDLAQAVGIGVGVVGTGFVAGAVFSYLGGLYLLMGGLAIVGFAGWSLSYLAYKRVRAKSALKTQSELTVNRNEIYDIVKQAFDAINA